MTRVGYANELFICPCINPCLCICWCISLSCCFSHCDSCLFKRAAERYQHRRRQATISPFHSATTTQR